MSQHIESGVNQFEGIFSQWYGWAGVPHTFKGGEEDPGGVRYDPYLDGPIRMFKWRARLDSYRLALKLKGRR